MGAHAEGTIIQSTLVEAVKYEYAPRSAHDDRPWRAVDVPEILILLMGDEDNEVRFKVDDIQEHIDDGELITIYIP